MSIVQRIRLGFALLLVLLLALLGWIGNTKPRYSRGFEDSVGRPGLEPGLFWTKTRRVASYTMGQ